jgi:hypothetical protein
MSQRAKLKGLDEKRISLLPAGLVLVHYILKISGLKNKNFLAGTEGGNYSALPETGTKRLHEVDIADDPRKAKRDGTAHISAIGTKVIQNMWQNCPADFRSVSR